MSEKDGPPLEEIQYLLMPLMDKYELKAIGFSMYTKNDEPDLYTFDRIGDLVAVKKLYTKLFKSHLRQINKKKY